jgi:hypothetical protein
MISETILGLVFGALLAACGLYLGARIGVLSRLRRHHEETWVSLGRPSMPEMFVYGPPAIFIATGEYRRLHDTILDRLVALERLGGICVARVALVLLTGVLIAGRLSYTMTGSVSPRQKAHVIGISLLAATFLSVALESWLLWRLRCRHREVWVSLCSPTLATVLGGRDRRRYTAFCRGGGYRTLRDPILQVVRRVSRVVQLAFLALLVAWLLGVLRAR